MVASTFDNSSVSFNTQPPEGGWAKIKKTNGNLIVKVSTHSRPKAAGCGAKCRYVYQLVSTHSRPKAAGQVAVYEQAQVIVSTHSRPKAAGIFFLSNKNNSAVSTHSRPKAAGQRSTIQQFYHMFQHTAARRRLAKIRWKHNILKLFQHTAARRRLGRGNKVSFGEFGFQHTAARRRLGKRCSFRPRQHFVSTHSRPKAAGKCKS